MPQQHTGHPVIVGGVDTHKDLHVAAAVDAHDHFLVRPAFQLPVMVTRTCWPGCVRLVKSPE